jgi:hypothetical protein
MGILPKSSNLILGVKLRIICEIANKLAIRLPIINAFMTFSLFNSLTRNNTRKYRIETKKARKDLFLLIENTAERKMLDMRLKIIMESSLFFNIKNGRFFSFRNKTVENSSKVIARGGEIGVSIVDKSPDLSAILFNYALLYFYHKSI